MAEPPKFPLPLGHVYGPSRLHINHHDGRGRLDAIGLRLWQGAYRSRWNRPRALDVTGLFDGPTQRAVLEVQRHCGMKRTGLLDRRTWDALWRRDPPPPRTRHVPEEKCLTKQPGYEKDRLRRKQYWEQFSQYRLGAVPDAPAWFPGRPFGPHERGDHVTRVQQYLGFNPSGRFQKGMMRRLRGLQRVHGLTETGVVDVDTARLLDELYGREEGDAPVSQSSPSGE